MLVSYLIIKGNPKQGIFLQRF